MVEAQAAQLEEQQRQVDIKTEEIKILLEKMDQYKRQKDEQCDKLKDSLAKA